MLPPYIGSRLDGRFRLDLPATRGDSERAGKIIGNAIRDDYDDELQQHDRSLEQTGMNYSAKAKTAMMSFSSWPSLSIGVDGQRSIANTEAGLLY